MIESSILSGIVDEMQGNRIIKENQDYKSSLKPPVELLKIYSAVCFGRVICFYICDVSIILF